MAFCVVCYCGFILFAFQQGTGEERGQTEQQEGYDLIVRNMKTLFHVPIYDVNTMRARTQRVSRKSGSFRVYPPRCARAHNRHTHTRVAHSLHQPNPTCNIVTFFDRVYSRCQTPPLRCAHSMVGPPPSFGYFSTARRRHHLIEYYIILSFFSLFDSFLRIVLCNASKINFSLVYIVSHLGNVLSLLLVVVRGCIGYEFMVPRI